MKKTSGKVNGQRKRLIERWVLVVLVIDHSRWKVLEVKKLIW